MKPALQLAHPPRAARERVARAEPDGSGGPAARPGTAGLVTGSGAFVAGPAGLLTGSAAFVAGAAGLVTGSAAFVAGFVAWVTGATALVAGGVRSAAASEGRAQVRRAATSRASPAR
jgi:hypothetical protein